MGVPELSLVIPAWNEAGTIAATVERWRGLFATLPLAHEILIVDDGSTDGTAGVVEHVPSASGTVLRVVRQDNRGHGAAVRRGYVEARGAWIMQIDADDEVGPEPFSRIWSRRGEADLVLGCRTERRQAIVRRAISRGARLVVRLLSGVTIDDVNAPYRLVRREVLTRMLEAIPDGTATPNVAMTWLASRWGLRVVQMPVPVVRARASGSLGGWRLLRTVLGGLRDASRVYLAARRASGSTNRSTA
jgi:dolichol-phosphate mannosyltransferase